MDFTFGFGFGAGTSIIFAGVFSFEDNTSYVFEDNTTFDFN